MEADYVFKIYADLREAAKRDILAVIPSKNNLINNVIIYYSNEVITNIVHCVMKLTINGKEFKIESDIDKEDFDKAQKYYEKGYDGKTLMINKSMIDMLRGYLEGEILNEYFGKDFFNNEVRNPDHKL